MRRETVRMNYCKHGVLTCSGATAAFWATRAAHVTATRVRATLTPTDPNQEQQQEEAKNHQHNQQPI